jgi:NADPH-dependent 7-cyano-7-deazaguanine reductase QueF
MKTVTSVNWEAFAEKHKGKEYEHSYFTLFNSACNCITENEDMSTIFCSELVAQWLIEVHVLTNSKPSCYYTPAKLARFKSNAYGDLERWQ